MERRAQLARREKISGDFGSTNSHASLRSSRRDDTPLICLNMIVRDEAAVIQECLESLIPWIDAWAIVDTGSTDSTVSIIQTSLSHLPGMLAYDTWTGDFAAHRNRALQLARSVLSENFGRLIGARLLLLDADESLVVRNPLAFKAHLRSGASIHWWLEEGGWRFRKLGSVLLENVRGWRHSIHEELNLNEKCANAHPIHSAHLLHAADGARRRRSDFSIDEEIAQLRNHAGDDPESQPAYLAEFYCARSLEAWGRYEAAVFAFQQAQQVCPIGGDDEWQCVWGRARCLEHIDTALAAEAYLAAHVKNISRAEPLVSLARIARLQQQPTEALGLAGIAMGLKQPRDTVMYDQSAYLWRAVDEAILAAAILKNFGELQKLYPQYQRVVCDMNVPAIERDRIRANWRHAAPGDWRPLKSNSQQQGQSDALPV